MAIEVHCDGCASTIRVSDQLAGRSGSCRHCGSSITIPHLDNLPHGQRLGDVSPEAMVEELRRRGRRAILLLIDGDTAKPGHGEDRDVRPAKLRTIGDDTLDPAQLAEFYHRLADRAEHRRATDDAAREEIEGDVFDLKGDQLGMSLVDFKQKHLRRVPGSDRVAPYCSDEFPGQKIEDLLTESWHSAAGIVHARVDLPEENAPPTIAGVKSKLVVYQFLDGKLFQVSAFFSPDAFHVLNAALTKKFGGPLETGQAPRSSKWWSMSSTIDLVCGSIRPSTPTSLSYRHDELLKEAGQRQPDAQADL